MKNFLQQFKEKTYYADETIIITMFGDICKLEDYPLLHLFRSEHYLLVSIAELKQTKNLKNKTREFSINVNKNWGNYLENFVADVEVWITNQSDKVLQGTSQDKSKLASYVLNQFAKDSNKINNLASLFSTDLSKFKRELRKLIDQEFSGQLREKLNKENFLSDLKKILPNTKNDVDKHDFVEKQAMRLIDNIHTKEIFTEVLSLSDIKVIIGNDFKKFQEITGNKPLGKTRAGQASTHGKLICVYWGEFYSEFPSLSLLGGMQLDPKAEFANCFKPNGAEEGRTQEFQTPLVRLLGEEFFDYLLRLSYEQEKDALFESFGKLLQGNDLLNVDKLKKIGGQPVIFNLLKENNNLIVESQKIIDKQNVIVELVLAGQPLKGEQKAIWESMFTKGRAIYKAAKPTPGKILLNTSSKTSVNSEGTIGPQKVKIPVSFKEFLSKEKLDCTTPSGSQVGVWETKVASGELDAKQVASLYRWFIDEYNQVVFEARQYTDAKIFGEFLGKFFGYQVFFPEYLETFLPKFHNLYKDIYQHKPRLTMASCEDETCVSACEVFPSQTSFNGTRENVSANEKSQSHQGKGSFITGKSEIKQATHQQTTVAWLSQELTSAAKTVLGVPNTTFMQHADYINSKSIEKPLAREQLSERLNQTASLEEWKVIGEFLTYCLGPYLPTLPWNQLHTLSDIEQDKLDDCLQQISELIDESSKLKNKPIGRYNLLADKFIFVDQELSQIEKTIRQVFVSKEITNATFSTIHKRIAHVKEGMNGIEEQNKIHKKQLREIEIKEQRLLSRGQQNRGVVIKYDSVSGELTHKIVDRKNMAPAQPNSLPTTSNRGFWKQQELIATAVKTPTLPTGKTTESLPKSPSPKR